MYIRVSEIPGDGLDVVARRGKDWIPRLLEGMDPYPLQTIGLLSAGLSLTVEGRDLYTDGFFVAQGEALCDRCSEPFTVRMEKEFRSVLLPQECGPAGAANVELHEGDLDVAFYDGVGIEVADLFWEQVAIALPVKLLCREECRGVCPRCGANRNREKCDCPAERESGSLGVLKNLLTEKE